MVHLYERALSALPYVGELWRDYHVYAIGLTYGSEEPLAPKVLDRCADRSPPSKAACVDAYAGVRPSADMLERVKNAHFRDVNDYATVLHAVIELHIRQGSWDEVVERVKAGFQHMTTQYSANNMARAMIYMLKEIVQFVFMSDPKNRPYVNEVFSSIENDAPFRTAAEFHTLTPSISPWSSATIQRCCRYWMTRFSAVTANRLDCRKRLWMSQRVAARVWQFS